MIVTLSYAGTARVELVAIGSVVGLAECVTMGPLVRLLPLSPDAHAVINTLATTKQLATARVIGTSKDCPIEAAFARHMSASI